MKNQTKKQFFTTVAATLAAASAFAQGDGSAGITEATTMISSYFEPATTLIYAIGAVTMALRFCRKTNSFGAALSVLKLKPTSQTVLFCSQVSDRGFYHLQPSISFTVS